MNILYLKNTREYHMDLIEVLKKRGHYLTIKEISDDDLVLLNSLSENQKNNLLHEIEMRNWDIAFSLDYYPCISMLCETIKKTYVSWCLEPPFSNLYSSTIMNSRNLIFTADKWLAESFQWGGIKNIFYLPEGVNIERCDRIRAGKNQEEKCLECSLMGEIYDPTWQELFQTEHLLDATLGYLEGMTASQVLIYGRDLWMKRLPEYLYRDLINNSNLRPRHDSVQDIQQYFAEQCFYPKTTAVDRSVVVKVLAQKFSMNTFSKNDLTEQINVINHGEILSDEKHKIIGKSKININIAPRGFKDGIYGQVLQIMGMGGFLITDYRGALEEEFVSGKEFIIYEDIKHLVECVEYYLAHSEERSEIGLNAYRKIRENHTLEQRIKIIEEKIEVYG